MAAVVDRIIELFETRGRGLNYGEAVTETEHALQCAHLATQAGSSDELVVAALLHDIGHLIHGLPEDIAMQGIDAQHETGGASWLAASFGPAVTDPVRLHVAAKRYLCAVDAGYHAGLSLASQQSLALQGGPMSPAEIATFEAEPHFRQAVAVRRWDDTSKTPGLVVPGVAAYRECLTSSLSHGGKS